MQRDMNLECWRIFATVAQAGSISASLDALDMNAPSVSRTISGLEKSLGTDLFDRSSHPMVLTENGKEALSAALEMLNTHDALLKRLHTNTEEMAGAIRVGVPAALLQSYLVPFFIEFSKKYPEIHLEATEYTAGLPVDFASKTGTLDLVISYGPDRSHPNYVQIHYGSGRFIPCASPTYLARHGKPQTPEELAKHIGIIFHSAPAPQAHLPKPDGRFRSSSKEKSRSTPPCRRKTQLCSAPASIRPWPNCTATARSNPEPWCPSSPDGLPLPKSSTSTLARNSFG